MSSMSRRIEESRGGGSIITGDGRIRSAPDSGRGGGVEGTKKQHQQQQRSSPQPPEKVGCFAIGCLDSRDAKARRCELIKESSRACYFNKQCWSYCFS